MDANAKNTRSGAYLAKRWETWDAEQPESAQWLSVTEKYRDHLAVPGQNDNLIFMGHRGTEGSRTPEDWPGQQYAAAPWDEETGYGSTTYASHQGGPQDPQDPQGPPGPRGPARGFPPAPGQPSPVYPQGDFDRWNEASADGYDGPWEDSEDGPDSQGGDWGEAGRTGEWASSQTGEWALADAEPRRWGEGSGQWDAPYGQWDEHGNFHEIDGSGQTGEPGQADEADGTGARVAGYSDYPGYDDRDGRRYDDQDFAGRAAAGRSLDRRSRDGAAGAAYGDEIDDGRDPARGRRGQGSRGSRGGGGTRARGSKLKTILLTGAGAVVVAALAATAYTFLTGRSGHSGAGANAAAPKLPTPTASATSGGSKYGKWGYLTSRATDATPLTVNELYPAQFMINGASFVRTTDRADTDCNSALFGSQLQHAAKAYDCNQVVRASYVSSDQTMMGTIGVVNLKDANDAAKAGNASGSTDFVTPLNGKTGPTKNLSQGTGVVQAEFKGHYLILIWAEYTNLKAPTTSSQRTQLEQFSSRLISGSANIALSNRMVNGRPQATGSAG